MNWKSTARLCLHAMGGLAMLRRMRRREARILMFHAFTAADTPLLEAVCGHIARNFEPVALSALVDSAEAGRSLPDLALTVTVDDGYRNYLEHAHPIFRRHRIPVTVYSVADFADGQLWLWTDQVAYCLDQTKKSSITAAIPPREPAEFDISSPHARRAATEAIWEELKLVPDAARQQFMAALSDLTGVEIPPEAPPGIQAMSWDELRGIAAEGVEIGCHTRTHPILSRLPQARLDGEIRGAKAYMEDRLGFPVAHFCYPNGRDIDIGDAAAECVRSAGFRSAATTVWGLHTPDADPMRLRRIPTGTDQSSGYIFELLAGLHMPRHFPEEKAALAA